VNVKVFGVIENMSGEIFGSGGGEKAAKDFNVPFLGRIPLNKNIVDSGDRGLPFVLESAEKDYVKEFNNITDKILNIIEKKN
jgi:ATP-binding protein involved in chromosome partitioning